MTGFGRGEANTAKHRCTVEISSVNRKQKDVLLSLPRSLQALESELRTQVEASVGRGRVQVQCQVESLAESRPGSIRIDQEVARDYSTAYTQAASLLGDQAPLRAADLLRYAGVITVETEDWDPAEVREPLVQALTRALGAWDGMRSDEGGHLRRDLQERLTLLRKLVARLAEVAEEVPARYRQQLRKRLEEAGLPLDLDDERLLKEIALFAERSDISEEITRLESHFQQFDGFLASADPVGRQIDFLLQEIHREYNTIGSKANHAQIAQAVVAAKTEVEKIREQVQNVE